MVRGRAVTGSNDSTARLRDLTNPDSSHLVSLSGHTRRDMVSSVIDTRLQVGLRLDLEIVPHDFWDLKNFGSSSRVLSGHTGMILSVALTADGMWAVTGSNDSTARLWDLKNPDTTPRILSGHAGAILSVALTPDGRWAATGSSG